MTTEEYLRKKYGSRAILGSAMEPDEEGEGFAPEELEQYRRPVIARSEAPPLVEAEQMQPEVPEMDALDAAREQDAEAIQRAGLTNASKRLGSAITAGIYRPDYVRPQLGAEDAARRRQQDVANYLLKKRQGETNAMNAEAALANANRPRVTQVAKGDPLLEEKRAKIKAETAKINRPPAEKKEKNGGLRELPAGEAATLGELGTVGEMIDDLGKAFGDARSMAAFVTKHLPGTKATNYGDIQLATAQVVGTILEGGKLTDADLPKYLRLVPDATDSKERAAQKIATLKRLIDLKRSGRLSGFKASKFDVSGFENSANNAGASSHQYIKSEGGFGYYYDENGELVKEKIRG